MRGMPGMRGTNGMQGMRHCHQSPAAHLPVRPSVRPSHGHPDSPPTFRLCSKQARCSTHLRCHATACDQEAAQLPSPTLPHDPWATPGTLRQANHRLPAWHRSSTRWHRFRQQSPPPLHSLKPDPSHASSPRPPSIASQPAVEILPRPGAVPDLSRQKSPSASTACSKTNDPQPKPQTILAPKARGRFQPRPNPTLNLVFPTPSERTSHSPRSSETTPGDDDQTSHRAALAQPLRRSRRGRIPSRHPQTTPRH